MYITTFVDFQNIKLEVDINPIDIMLYADKSQMSQVLLNILKNAIESCDSDDKLYNIEIKAFIDNEDIHAKTASDIFGIDIKDVDFINFLLENLLNIC